MPTEKEQAAFDSLAELTKDLRLQAQAAYDNGDNQGVQEFMDSLPFNDFVLLAAYRMTIGGFVFTNEEESNDAERLL